MHMLLPLFITGTCFDGGVIYKAIRSTCSPLFDPFPQGVIGDQLQYLVVRIKLSLQRYFYCSFNISIWKGSTCVILTKDPSCTIENMTGHLQGWIQGGGGAGGCSPPYFNEERQQTMNESAGKTKSQVIYRI